MTCGASGRFCSEALIQPMPFSTMDGVGSVIWDRCLCPRRAGSLLARFRRGREKKASGEFRSFVMGELKREDASAGGHAPAGCANPFGLPNTARAPYADNSDIALPFAGRHCRSRKIFGFNGLAARAKVGINKYNQVPLHRFLPTPMSVFLPCDLVMKYPCISKL